MAQETKAGITLGSHPVVRVLAALSRLLLAAVFIVSGFSKLDDPIGMAFKLGDYASVMGFGSEVARGLFPIASTVLGTLEFCLGIYMLFGIRRNATMVLVLLMMAVMTPLTLWVAVADPVPDCGCFGDMVTLTGWQTFAKNVVLTAAALLLFWRRRGMVRLISEGSQWMVSMYTIIYAVALAGLSMLRLPPIDFRPYHVGADLRHAMTNFAAFDMETDEDMTDSLLSDTGHVVLLVMPNIERARVSQIYRINMLYDYCTSQGVRMAALTGTLDADATERWRDMNGAEYPILWADETELKTVVRSNPGLVVLKDGVVRAKWANFDMPLVEQDDAQKPIGEQEWAADQQESRSAKWLRLLLAYMLPLVVITSLDRLVAAMRWAIGKIRQQYFPNKPNKNN